jgi:glycosyltransferase involved in cell wall biosynthesis
MASKPHIMILSKGGSFWPGGRQYTLNLLEALVRGRCNDDAFDVSVLVNSRDELIHYESLRPHLRVCAHIENVQAPYSLTNKARWRIKRSIARWYNPRLEEAMLRMGVTFAYPVRSTKLPSAEWIPDFQYKYFPDGSNSNEVEGRKREFAAIVRTSKTVVLSSACAELDCHELFPQSVGRTLVLRFRVFVNPAWLTCDPAETVRRYHLPSRFVLISNHLAPTKNHAVVLKALSSMSVMERSRLHVVCTGEIYDYRNPNFHNGFLAQIQELGLRDCISMLGLIPKQDQVQLLRAAVAYLQPSLFEGWNTGVEEAHLLGKPILLSDIPIHREQAPPRAIYFDPRNADDLAARLAEMIDNAAPTLDFAVERQALGNYTWRQVEFAKQFLEIATVNHPFGERTLSAPAVQHY